MSETYDPGEGSPRRVVVSSLLSYLADMTSVTQRSSGLVQRRTDASRNAADKDRPTVKEDQESRPGEEQGDEEIGDSKETRLTLMEEVLLLGLKDREVKCTTKVNAVKKMNKKNLHCKDSRQH